MDESYALQAEREMWDLIAANQPESDTAKERRLSRQANEVCLGVIQHPEIPAKTGQFARVEVTYQRDEESREEAGFFRVYFPVECDPYETAYELVEAELQKRYPDAAYTSVDDILSR